MTLYISTVGSHPIIWHYYTFLYREAIGSFKHKNCYNKKKEYLKINRFLYTTLEKYKIKSFTPRDGEEIWYKPPTNQIQTHGLSESIIMSWSDDQIESYQTICWDKSSTKQQPLTGSPSECLLQHSM
jgi:hypothetical protein